MGFEMEYRIDGRKVTKTQWERHLREAPLEAIKEDLKKRISRLRCRTHGQSPRVSFTKTSRGFDAKVSGCCDELIEQAQRIIG